MPYISPDINFLAKAKTFYDALRYSFADMTDYQFEIFINTIKIEENEWKVPQKYITNVCCSLNIKDIVNIKDTVNIDANINKEREAWINFLFDITKNDYTHYFISYKTWLNEKCNTPILRLNHYFIANKGVSLYLDYTPETIWKTALDELDKDIKKYNYEDVVFEFTKVIGITRLIELCQKYNYMELLVSILRFTKDSKMCETNIKL